jgi:hypothetical protein
VSAARERCLRRLRVQAAGGGGGRSARVCGGGQKREEFRGGEVKRERERATRRAPLYTHRTITQGAWRLVWAGVAEVGQSGATWDPVGSMRSYGTRRVECGVRPYVGSARRVVVVVNEIGATCAHSLARGATSARPNVSVCVCVRRSFVGWVSQPDPVASRCGCRR